jgi:hypothetical protein
MMGARRVAFCVLQERKDELPVEGCRHGPHNICGLDDLLLHAEGERRVEVRVVVGSLEDREPLLLVWR